MKNLVQRTIPLLGVLFLLVPQLSLAGAESSAFGQAEYASISAGATEDEVDALLEKEKSYDQLTGTRTAEGKKSKEDLGDGRSKITYTSTATGKDSTSTYDTVTVYLKDGKVIAKEYTQNRAFDKYSYSDAQVLDNAEFQDAFGEDFELTDQYQEAIDSRFDGTDQARYKGTQGNRKTFGPVGGEVATGEDAEQTYVDAVVRESEELGSGENPISPIDNTFIDSDLDNT
ncbi:MAG: hypothetical protein JJ921_09520 [Pseudomonadales bacterium]|nr:hypothetical protein [Pseudomonadales bacterium]MBO7006354.1 hypothetical protein [Pseudomonadales bacterium]